MGMSSTENMYSEWELGNGRGMMTVSTLQKGQKMGKKSILRGNKYLRTCKRKRISANKFKLNATIYTNIQ